MKRLLLVGALVLAMNGSAEAAHWSTEHARIGAHHTAVLRSSHLPATSVVLTWVRADAQALTPDTQTPRAYFYSAPGFRLVEHYGPNRVTWRVSNYSHQSVVIRVGYRTIG